MPFFAQPKDLFAGQFEPEGADFPYRKSMRGAPIRVTAAERDKFVNDFGRRAQVLKWSLVGAVMALVLGSVGYAEVVGRDMQDPLIYGGTGLLIAAFVLVWYRTWNAPARALARRTPVGAVRTRFEVRRDMLANTSWVQIFVMIGVLGILILAGLPLGRETWNSRDWTVLILGGSAFVAWLWLAVIKLRVHR